MNILKLITPKKAVRFLTTNLRIDKALLVLEKYRFNSVPLLDKEGYYIGTITEGDLLWFLKDNNFENWDKRKLKDVVRNRDYAPVTINAAMDELVNASLNQNFIPILDDRNFFIGIVTRKDLLSNFITYISDNEIEEGVNPVISSLYKRRSIRRFKNELVDPDIIKEILDTALVSPTARNSKSAHVIFFDDKDKIRELSMVHERAKRFENAPYLLMVFNDDEKESKPFYANNNCSALMMSLLLAIESTLELGGFWIGAGNIEHNEKISEALALPGHLSLYGIIAFGVKDEQKPANEPLNQERIHLNKW